MRGKQILSSLRASPTDLGKGQAGRQAWKDPKRMEILWRILSQKGLACFASFSFLLLEHTVWPCHVCVKEDVAWLMSREK